jgi:hypothetical protein
MTARELKHKNNTVYEYRHNTISRVSMAWEKGKGSREAKGTRKKRDKKWDKKLERTQILTYIAYMWREVGKGG